jgi:uncharacterized protein DUF3459
MLNPIQIPDDTPIHGPLLHADGSATFSLWAPVHERVLLEIQGHPARYVMAPAPIAGWHGITVPKLHAGARYAFVLPDKTRVPDPASHFQPEGVSGLSELIDPRSYRWRDQGWSGRPWYSSAYLVRGPQAVTVQWLSVEGVLLRLNANLSDSVCGGFPVAEGREVWMEGHRDERGVLQPRSVQWSLIRD